MPGPPGEVTVDADGAPTLAFRRVLALPVEQVWAAVTESDRLAAWIGTWSGEPRVGGTVTFVMTGEVDAGGEVGDPGEVTILACDPPRRLVVDLPGTAPEAAWRVAVTLEPRDEGTALRFEQRVPEGLAAADLEAGWRWYLDRLEASLAGRPLPPWEDYAV